MPTPVTPKLSLPTFLKGMTRPWEVLNALVYKLDDLIDPDGGDGSSGSNLEAINLERQERIAADTNLQNSKSPTGHTHLANQITNFATAVAALITNKADLVSGKVPTSQLPAITIGESFTVASQAAMLALTAQIGDVAVRTDLANRKFILLGTNSSVLANWQDFVSTGNVASVNGQTGAVVLASVDVGLGNVADLSPADLPLSAATIAALLNKAPQQRFYSSLAAAQADLANIPENARVLITTPISTPNTPFQFGSQNLLFGNSNLVLS